ncbi:tubulin-like doman-containing protein [Bowmanella sp. JS7-9]|uniref:Tubulin-like doman-containing protein n=1 Tax=Pseudobowmanella zhangzhouensis TaxID=1537679 RepID=A0ABW1XII8_9ALTE|nr:tubulin-like doman-containing protein [Bowmanella sp. JS7-9]
MQNKRTPVSSRKAPLGNNNLTLTGETHDVIVTSPEPKNPSPYLYFTESDLNRILANLNTLRESVYANAMHDKTGEGVEQALPSFPSVCLIGLGRCGSNIALDVAHLVHSARRFYLSEFNSEQKRVREKDNKPLQWIQRSLHLKPSKVIKPVFLIEPLVMLGDLDKDIAGRIRFSSKGENQTFLRDYNKLKIMDLSEVHAGGSGNAPILGQYLAQIILNKETDNFNARDWKMIHSYLIDSCGIKANQSRLYFFIFSAGGGTGSGMASEFGLAQQYSYMSKTFNIRTPKEINNQSQSFVFEPIFTSGICILPNITNHDIEMSEALHINAGRLLCKYLSEEWNFSYNLESDTKQIHDDDILRRIRPWNAMMLISNDIMRYAEQGDNSEPAQNIDVNAMEKYANQYISQQIFNILTAQAVTTDYDENYFRRAGIDIGETIRLDANDLFMSLAGPVAVAYAESVVTDNGVVEKPKLFNSDSATLDIDDLFFRSIDLPHFNKDTQAIEGVSLLPIESKRYRKALEHYRNNNYDPKYLRELHFFKNCSSVVSIVSLPKDYKLSYVALNKLKTHLNSLFPNTTLKRYALVIGASANLSLTTLIAKSPCLSDDFLTLLVAFIKRCFAKDQYRFDDSLDRAIVEFIRAPELDEKKLESMLCDCENPAKILDTNWYAIKPMYEKKYREIIGDNKKFRSINDIRLTLDSVKNAIRYLREIYRHRISKTQVISLNDDFLIEDDIPSLTESATEPKKTK